MITICEIKSEISIIFYTYVTKSSGIGKFKSSDNLSLIQISMIAKAITSNGDNV